MLVEFGVAHGVGLRGEEAFSVNRSPAKIPDGPQIEAAAGVDVEVVKGAGIGQIVAQPGGVMHEQVGFEFGHQPCHAIAVADIQFMLGEGGIALKQAILVPAGVAGGAKEIRTVVVINAVDPSSVPREILDNFRADEPR